eukprot:13181979-Alexandrium_andersonii.AAC.1
MGGGTRREGPHWGWWGRSSRSKATGWSGARLSVSPPGHPESDHVCCAIAPRAQCTSTGTWALA